MRDEIELLYTDMPGFNGSIAIDLYPWTFLLGLSRIHHVVSSQGKVWKEYTLWFGPICVTLTFYGGGR